VMLSIPRDFEVVGFALVGDPTQSPADRTPRDDAVGVDELLVVAPLAADPSGEPPPQPARTQMASNR
jgi:hypothetical protein